MRYYDGLDGGDDAVSTPDLQKTPASVSTSNLITSKDSYSVTIENLPVKLTGNYNFVFQYYYENPDKTQTTPILGPTSATYSVAPTIQDLSTAPTNVVATGGFYSYQLKWDTPTFISYGDTIVYESNTNSFNSSSKVVYVGTSNQCTILTSDILPKYVYVVHRDMFLDANKKGTVVGPITIQDPITVDSNPPTNTFSVGTTTIQDDPDGLFTFNKKILFTWTENSDATTYGYQIRFRRLGTTDYTYMSAPGKATTSTYLYGVKAGQTYEISVTTYDQFGNINTSDWKSYPNIVIPASTSLAADVAITAGDMKMGYGIGGDNANKGLYLGPENYWYIQGNTTASSAARLSVGGTSDKLVWDGTNLSVTGNLTARAGTFSGNILMSSSNASIYNGTINSAGNLTGNGFALNASGLKVANGTNSVTIDALNGRIIANAGTIGGWSLTDSLLNQNNARLSSTGYIELGGANTDNIIRLDANDGTYRMWIGRNSSSTAPFKVTKEGVLYATGAVLTNLEVGSTLSDGTSLNTVKNNAATGATALQPSGTLTGNVSGTINNVAVSTVTSGAAAGASAIQAGNGVGIDSTSKYINTIDLNSSGIVIKTSANSTKMQLTNAGLELFQSGTRTVFIDAATGNASFAGDVRAKSGRLGDTDYWNIGADGVLADTAMGTQLFPTAKTSGSYTGFGIYSNRYIGGSGGLVVSGTSPASSLTFAMTNNALIASLNSIRVNDAFAPNSDNTYSLGFTTDRWQIVRSAGGVSTTSDSRIKTDIHESDLGLDFIKKLRPVKFKFISGGMEPAEGEQKELVGNKVVEPTYVSRPGIRDHYGFIAQEVKSAIDECGVNDFAGWQLADKNDPESQQSLVHHHFIAPLTKSIQELANMVELLQEEINILKGI